MRINSYHNGEYPRPLTDREREWIEWILPPTGYHSYRDAISGMMVIGEGRRGKGELILGNVGDKTDFSEPLPSVAAYGVIETNLGPISITLREILNNQISVEIVSHRLQDIPQEFQEFGYFLTQTISAVLHRSAISTPNIESLWTVSKSGLVNEVLSRWQFAGFSRGR